MNPDATTGLSESEKDLELRRLREQVAEQEARLSSRALSGRPTGSVRKALGGVALIGALGVAAYALTLSRGTGEEQLATAEPGVWQDAGDGFEAMPVPAAPAEDPIVTTPPTSIGADEADEAEVTPAAARPALVPTGPSASEIEMMQSIAGLRAEIEALRAGNETSGTSDRLDELTDQVAELNRALREAERGRREAEQDARQLALDLEEAKVFLEAARRGDVTVGAATSFPVDPATEPVPTQFEVSGAGVPTDEEAERRARLRERMDEQEAAFLDRITSPMIAFGGSASPAEPEAGREAAPGEAFVQDGARRAEVQAASIIANPSRTVVQGTVIQAALETAIDSSLPGAIRAVVSEDVHSFDGTRILIPRGSRLIGRYDSGLDVTQRRILVAWDRIVTPDGQSVEIAAYGADALGRSGTTGLVDRRLGTRLGASALVSLISALPAIASASAADGAVNGLTLGVGDDTSGIATDALEPFLNVPPTIHVDQGARITVLVDRDLEML